MKPEFNLSEEIWEEYEGFEGNIRVKSVKEFIKRVKEEISDINKHMDLHNVDECDCCEKNWASIYRALEIIDKNAGEKLK